jgi:hypothetical protein
MVHARTGLDGVRGTLALEEEALVFRPDAPGAPAWWFRLEHLRRVRRVRFSPVLEVEVRPPGTPPLVGFYFVQPPSLRETREELNPFRRRSARKAAIRQLRLANRWRKDEIEGWVRAISESMCR